MVGDSMGQMSQQSLARAGVALVAALAFAALPPFSVAAAEAATQGAPSGVWRGTSTCTDRGALPACNDEVVVYEFTAGAKPGTVHWKADKIVDGQRALMGESELAYDTGDACWRAELNTPRVHIVWCLVVDGAHMTGTGRLLPSKQTVRKIDVRKD
jgi:hypothetical protein